MAPHTSKPVTVQILDQSFVINTDASPDRVRKVAEAVSVALQQVSPRIRTKAVSPYHTAILAALNIAEKYVDLLEQQDEFRSTVVKRSKKVLELLELSEKSSAS